VNRLTVENSSPLPQAVTPRVQPQNGRRRIILIALVTAVVVAGSLWVIAFSPMLGAKTITVRGTHLLTVQQVRGAAAVKQGRPLVRLDRGAIARRVEALPEVASATVRTTYPSTVTVTVVERVPLGFVESGQRFVLVDKTGDQFRTVSSRPKHLPLFAVPSGPKAKATGEALAQVAAALSAQLLTRVAAIEAFDPTTITLLLTDHRVVRWGTAERDADKARILPTLLAQPGTQFDVTDPDQPFTR
jgi:cell division protein FtsQ